MNRPLQPGRESGGDAPLRLRATDEADLRILSACLQDALIPLGDMAWLTGERRFVLVASRLRRECGASRVLSALTVGGVRRVRRRRLAESAVDGFLCLLSIEVLPAADGVCMELVFAGGGGVRLDLDRIEIWLEDTGDAWPSQWKPDHKGQA